MTDPDDDKAVMADHLLAELYDGRNCILVSKAFYEAFSEAVNPWQREIKRARRQLSMIAPK